MVADFWGFSRNTDLEGVDFERYNTFDFDSIQRGFNARVEQTTKKYFESESIKKISQSYGNNKRFAKRTKRFAKRRKKPAQHANNEK